MLLFSIEKIGQKTNYKKQYLKSAGFQLFFDLENNTLPTLLIKIMLFYLKDGVGIRDTRVIRLYCMTFD